MKIRKMASVVDVENQHCQLVSDFFQSDNLSIYLRVDLWAIVYCQNQI